MTLIDADTKTLVKGSCSPLTLEVAAGDTQRDGLDRRSPPTFGEIAESLAQSPEISGDLTIGGRAAAEEQGRAEENPSSIRELVVVAPVQVVLGPAIHGKAYASAYAVGLKRPDFLGDLLT